MALTDDELAEVLEWVPWDATAQAEEALLDDVHDRVGTKWAVILSRLRARKSYLVTNPASFNADGEWTQSTVENIKALERDIAKVEGIIAGAPDPAVPGGSTFATGQLVRHDPNRRIPRR